MKRAFYLILLYFCSCIAPQHLIAQATVQGVVTDSVTGSPISGAGVGIFLGNNPVYNFPPPTGPNGFYSISGVAPNNYTIVAVANNYQGQPIGISPTDSETLIQNLQLTPTNTGQITGTVVIANTTTPIAGAKVTASLANLFSFSATTNASGQYTIPNLGPGFYVVAARATGFQAVTQQSVGVSTGATTTQNFQLPPNTSILTGQITAASNGMPLSGVLVSVVNQVKTGYSQLTNASGFYTFSGLPAGTWSVTAQPPPTLPYQITTQSAQVVNNMATVLNFALESLIGTIAGTVTDASTRNPIPGATINILQNNTVITTALTDQNGQYNISGLTPGSYQVQAQATPFQTQVLGANVNANATSTVNFSLVPDPGTISGLVTDTLATPIANALVTVNDGQVQFGSGFTNASGNYSISQLPPGSYTVNASQENFQTQSQGAIVTSNTTTPINFTLSSIFGEISGTVKDATMQAIVGASVFVFNQQTFLSEIITDVNGFYTFTNLAPGDFTVLASADGYQSAFQKATVIANTTTTGVDFTLQTAPGIIVGTVISAADNTPIKGAIVEVFSNFTSIKTVVTDPFGLYIITGLAPGNYLVNARASSFQTEVKEANVTADRTTTVDFTLKTDPGAIFGKVTDAATSAPLGGASIKVYNDQQVLIRTTLTQPDGFYLVLGLTPGSYNVTASQDNYQTKSAGAIVTSLVTTTVNIALLPDPGTIAGTVTDAVTTQPIVGASVFVFDKLILKGQGLTDIIGNYTIPNLAPGSYTVLVNAENYHITTQGATVSSNTTTTVNFKLQPDPGTIAGTVTNKANGTPIPGANIQVFDKLTFIASALTDPNGNYSIPSLAPGNYNVVASATDFSIAFAGALNVSSHNTTTVNFALSPDPGRISGTVNDASTNAPIPGATIQVYNGLVIAGAAITDSNGAYTVPGLKPDSYTVTVLAPGFQKPTPQIATVDSLQTTTVNFSLTSSINGGSIAGIVISAATSNPIPNATVAIFKGTTLLDFTLTDVNGNYTISDLAPINYVVLATAKGFEAAISLKTVVAGSTTRANFALNSDPGKIVGKVTDKCTGDPIPGALILATKNSLIFSFGLSDNNGNFSVEDLAAGSYIVTASKKDFVTGSSEAVVNAHATTTLNFSLLPVVEPPASISGHVIKNKFLSQTDIIHVISWTASPSECVKGYQIFRNGHKIAFVSSKDKLEYLDHNRHKKADVYSVKTIDTFGQVSTAVKVTVGGSKKVL